MIETDPRPMAKRLSPVLCGRCSHPVGHMNKAVPGAEAGGLCTRCTKDERTGKPMAVWTYYGIVEASSIRISSQPVVTDRET